MPLVKANDLRAIATSELPIKFSHIFDENLFEKTASKRLHENYIEFSSTKKYDIFLSHSYDDALTIYGLKLKLEQLGLTVFVDWDEDNFPDRENINSERALELRKQMQSCNSLLFVTSENSIESIWMPWELGYFDGYKGKVAIMPLNEDRIEKTRFEGQEYLGIYPYVKDYSGFLTLFFSNGRIVRLVNWIK